MCKIMALTNTSKLDIKRATKVISEILTVYEKDGFGYAVQGENGVFGEKSIADVFNTRFVNLSSIDLPITKKTHQMFGNPSKGKSAGIWHSRTSTNTKGLLNCHPMQRDGWNLIHNGVVTDYGPKYKKLTGNDSEDVLKRLIDGIDKVERHLSGYYAVAAIDPQGRLHVVKDATARLVVCHSPTINSYIFATNQDLIEQLAKKLKLKISPIDSVEDNVYFTFDGNDIVSCQTIKPRGYTYYESQYAKDSLGHDIDDRPYYNADQPRDLLPPSSSRPSSGTYSSARHGNNDQAKLSYYHWRHAIQTLSEDHQIFDRAWNTVKLADFKAMDYIDQSYCTIIKPDGKIIEKWDDYENANEVS